MMELCAVRVIRNPLPVHTHVQPLLPSSRTHSPFIILKHNPRFASGLRYCVNSHLSSTTSGEISTNIADKPNIDGVVTQEDASADDKQEGSDPHVNEANKLGSDGGVVTSYYTPPVEKKEAVEPKTDSSVTVENANLDEKKEDSNTLRDLQLSKLLEDLGVEIDFEENKYSILTLGGAGLIALWLASVVVGAIDHIPLLPKVLELVGLGYSIWFTIRYLIFKESREEFVAKVEQVKQEIFDSDDD